MLTGMRADHLLAASLAGSLEGLRNALVTSLLTARSPLNAAPMSVKALGDANDDLVYTPVVPCRLADTRSAVGSIASTGLTGGPITSTGTISIANGSVGRAQLVTNAVTQAKLSPLSGAAAGKVLGTDGTRLNADRAQPARKMR